MRVTKFEFDGITYSGREYKTITLSLKVDVRSIQNVIEKSKSINWKVSKLGYQTLSNAVRNCAIMTYTSTPSFVQQIMDNLEIGHCSSLHLEYYRSAMCAIRTKYFKMNRFVFEKTTRKFHFDYAPIGKDKIFVTNRGKHIKYF